MALNYEAQHQFGQSPAWSFVDDQTGERIYLDNPMQAMQLGAPMPGAGQTPMGQSIPAPAPMPDQRLALGMFGNSPPPAGTPPVMNPSAGIVGTAPSVADAGPSMSEDPNALQSSDPSALQSTVLPAEPEAQQQPMAPPPPADPTGIARGIAQRNLELLAGDSPLTYSPGRAGSAARFEPTQRTFKGDPDATEGLMSGYSDLAQYQADTAAERVTVEQRRANQVAEQAMMDSIRLDVQRSDAAKLRDQQKTEYDRRLGAINTELQNVSQKKVNPNRFWDDADAGTTLLAGIALAMGAFGSSVNGGPNQAMQIINDYIDRDTQKQMDEIRSAKEGVELKRNAFQEWLANGNDWKQTEQIMKALKYEHAEAIARNLAAIETRQDLQLAYRDTIAAINKEKLDTFAGLEQSFGASLTERFLPEQRAVAGGYKLDMEKLGKQSEIATQLAKQAADAGMAPEDLDKAVAAFSKDMAGQGVNPTRVEAAYARVDALRKELEAKYDGKLPGIGGAAGKFPDAVVNADELRFRTAVAEVIELSLRDLTGAAATEEEKEDRRKQIGRINELTTSAETAMKIYDDSRRMNTDILRRIAAGHGGAPVWERYRQNYQSTAGMGTLGGETLDLREPE